MSSGRRVAYHAHAKPWTWCPSCEYLELTDKQDNDTTTHKHPAFLANAATSVVVLPKNGGRCAGPSRPLGHHLEPVLRDHHWSASRHAGRP